jgi:hypothetical protein
MNPESLAECLERWDIAITFRLRVKSHGIRPAVLSNARFNSHFQDSI